MAETTHQPTYPVTPLFYRLAGVTLVIAESMMIPTLPGWTAQQNCRVVGRIISADGTAMMSGKPICAGDQIKSKITFFCTSTGRIQEGFPGKLEEQGCRTNVAVEFLCPGNLICRRPKGGRDESLTVTSPLGASLLKSPQEFSWIPITSAHSYLVQVEGIGVQWQKLTTQATLPYPADVSPLQAGQTYKITVIALDAQGDPLLGKIKALSILSPIKVSEIQSTARQLQQLRINSDELSVIDLKALYLANGLVEESIAALETRVAANTQNPLVHQALGQIYTKVGNVSKATAAYRRAIELAQSQGLTEAQKVFEAELNQVMVAWQSEPASQQ